MANSNDIPPAPKRTRPEQQAEAEALFTSIGDGAISTDEFGRITRINPAGQELLGFTEKELIGTWFPQKIVAVTEDNKPVNLIDRPITRAFLTGKPVAEKLYYRCKNGRVIALSINVSPILLDGKPLGAIEVFRDITFEQEVDRMKSEFISLASHQLRTPLSAIQTYTHMLIEGYMGQLNNDQKQSLKTVIRATNRMNELISVLLNVTRLEGGTIDITPKLVQVDKLAEDICTELELLASGKAIDLGIVTQGKGSTGIRTDGLILKEIMINLVSNAIKYTPESGKVRIIVRPRKSSVVIEIADTGWGIPKSAQDQVFSKFFRAPNIVKRETTGTGLGLYLVKGLVDALDGKIWFSSEEGKGTKFAFSLPRHKPGGKARKKDNVNQLRPSAIQ